MGFMLMATAIPVAANISAISSTNRDGGMDVSNYEKKQKKVELWGYKNINLFKKGFGNNFPNH